MIRPGLSPVILQFVVRRSHGHLPSPFGVEIKEVARQLGVSVSHVYRIAQRDPTFPPSRRIGRSARYDPGEIRIWYEAQIVARAKTRRGRSAGAGDTVVAV